jgi:hypothetical protein
MLDTIRLTLDKAMFLILDVGLFQKERQNASRGYFTLVQNSTKSELANGIYKPRLTLTRRFNCSRRFEETLAIELSLPKLIFGNNFDELRDNNFTIVLEKLVLVLKTMGIRVFTHILSKAPVSAIHYSKNIPLTDGSTSHYYISKLQQANSSLALDVNKTDFSNEGYGYKWHSNSYEVAFYDKIHDLGKAKKSDKRSVEDNNTLQLNLIEKLRLQKPLEVLRMEVRINNRQKLRQLLQKLHITTEPTFINLFNSMISQKILLYYLNEIERNRLSVLDYQTNKPEALLIDLVINNPEIGIKRTLQLYGLKHALDSVNPRELRAIFGKYHPRSWYRLFSEAKKVKLPPTKNPFIVIRNHLTKFDPLKLVDISDKMINNDKYDQYKY